MKARVPDLGEIVVVCIHLVASNQARGHVYQLDAEPIKYRRPDGTIGLTRFAKVCDRCHAADDFSKIGGEYEWSDADYLVQGPTVQ